MKSKEFKEPGIPKELLKTEDAMAVLKEAKEQETEIIKRHFKGTFLTKFDGSRIAFRQVVFENCRFMGCKFDEAEFVDVRFISCDFSNTSIVDTYFKNCSFNGFKAVGTDFYGSNMRHVSFENCTVTDAGFDAVRMSYIRTKHVDFTRSGFSKCNIINADWKDTCFQEANFFKTSLMGMDLSDCNLEGIIISDGKEELRGAVVNMFQALALAKRLGVVIKEM